MNSLKQKAKSGIVVNIGDKSAIIAVWKNGIFDKSINLESTRDEDMLVVKNIFNANKSLTVSILLDISDQGYHYHAFPNVNKRDLKKIIDREINREYKSYDIKEHFYLGKKNINNVIKNEVVIATTSLSDIAKKLIDFCKNEIVNIIDGIFLLPIETRSIIEYLSKKDDTDSKDAQNPIVKTPQLILSDDKKKQQIEMGHKDSFSSKLPFVRKKSVHKIDENQVSFIIIKNALSGSRLVVFKGAKLVFSRIIRADFHNHELLGKEITVVYDYISRFASNEDVAKKSTINYTSTKMQLIVFGDVENLKMLSGFNIINFDIKLYNITQLEKLVGKENLLLSKGHKLCDIILMDQFFYSRHSSNINDVLINKIRLLKYIKILPKYIILFILIFGTIEAGTLIYNKIEMYTEIFKKKKILDLTTAEFLSIQKEILGVETTNLDEILEIGRINENMQKIKANPMYFVASLSKVLSETDSHVRLIDWSITNFSANNANYASEFKVLIKIRISNHSASYDELVNLYDKVTSVIENKFGIFANVQYTKLDKDGGTGKDFFDIDLEVSGKKEL